MRLNTFQPSFFSRPRGRRYKTAIIIAGNSVFLSFQGRFFGVSPFKDTHEVKNENL